MLRPLILYCLFLTMLLEVASCGVKKNKSSKFYFHEEDFLRNPPLAPSTSFSYVRSPISRNIATALIPSSSVVGLPPSYNPNSLPSSSLGPNYMVGFPSVQSNPPNLSRPPITSSPVTGVPKFHNPGTGGLRGPLVPEHYNTNRAQSLTDFRRQVQNPGNFSSKAASFNYRDYKSKLGKGALPLNVPLMTAYTFTQNPWRGGTSHNQLLQILHNADGQYEFRHGVHYIKNGNVVYGITFELPISANPIATRNIQSDSGYYINTP